MKSRYLFLYLGLLFGLASPAKADTVVYDLIQLGSGMWEYTYSVTNNSLTDSIEEFTIYFPFGEYDDLAVTTPLVGWDELTVNPDLVFGFQDDGFYDALALHLGILPGETLNGFSVSFLWLGTGTPGTQYFEIVDALTFDVLDSGHTTQASEIGEPGVGVSLLLGLTGLAFFRHRKELHDGYSGYQGTKDRRRENAFCKAS